MIFRACESASLRSVSALESNLPYRPRNGRPQSDREQEPRAARTLARQGRRAMSLSSAMLGCERETTRRLGPSPPPTYSFKHLTLRTNQNTNRPTSNTTSGGPNNRTPSNQWAQSISHSGTLVRAALIAHEKGSIDFEIKSSCTSTTIQIHAADAQSQIRSDRDISPPLSRPGPLWAAVPVPLTDIGSGRVRCAVVSAGVPWP